MSRIQKTIILALIVGISTAGYFFFEPTSSKPKEKVVEINSEVGTKDEYSLINKSVTSNVGKHFIINFKPLKRELEGIQKKYAQKTYIYFSYLNNASWIGLNERDDFTAASTLKVPVAMALLKATEEGKLKLSDSYSLEELDLNNGFGDLYKVGADKEFTVGELLEIMLVKSDNTALNALDQVFKRIGIDAPLEAVYGFLGWEFTQKIPEVGETPDYSKINLKTLSNLFIALYDAKYVNIENSSKILGHLSKSNFNDRIAAGVPEGIIVSHKIGTAATDDSYSDCGIIYAPNRHYILCLGSVGANETIANQFMAEASKTVYDYVINN